VDDSLQSTGGSTTVELLKRLDPDQEMSYYSFSMESEQMNNNVLTHNNTHALVFLIKALYE